MLRTFELERIGREVEENSAAIASLCAGLSEVELSRRPAPNKWSLAEIVAHLNLTTQQGIPAVDAALADAERRSLRSFGPFRLTLMGRFFVWYVEPPPAIRLPAPKTLVPQLTGPPTEVLPQFLDLQQQMLSRIQRADGLDLNRARFRSPWAGFVTMDLMALFSVFTAHQRRHIWQARNLEKGITRTAAPAGH